MLAVPKWKRGYGVMQYSEDIGIKNVTDNITEWRTFISNFNYTTCKKDGIIYLNIPCSFDIEVSSFYNNGEKVGVMYAFALDIFHNIYLGRTWAEFKICIEVLNEVFKLHPKRLLTIYVHNLSYEFQFMSYWEDWRKVFAIEMRKVVYAINGNIIFRCSYLLSGYSLASLADNRHLPIKKLTGDLDYSLIRLNNTPLTEEEKNYIINDVEIVVYYISELLKEEKNIINIPITKTAYVRRLMRKKCRMPSYHKMIDKLTIIPEEYELLKECFQGGFTHGAMLNIGRIHKNISSFDFTSSYPAVMLSERFPMSRGEWLHNPTESDIKNSLDNFCCVMVISYKNIHLKAEAPDAFISYSKCTVRGKFEVFNGRLSLADEIFTVITNVDFEIYRDFYNYDEFKIHTLIRYYKGYLPKEIIEGVLELYENKTKLKGVKGAELEYLNSKEQLNSTYGMTVTDILRDEIVFKNGWDESNNIKIDPEKGLEKYNTNKDRFLFYVWGIFITAYARRNLATAILEAGADYQYSDTDSVKLSNAEKHNKYFEEYNKQIVNKIKYVLELFKIDPSRAEPKTIKGESKPLGVWTYEGTYNYFKTLGAKRYIVVEDGVVSLTVSGLNKRKAVPHMLQKLNIDYTVNEYDECVLTNEQDYKKLFDYFDDELYIPPNATGKNIHTYIDESRSGKIKDYLGVEQEYYEERGIHMEGAEYSLKLSDSILKIFFEEREF